jgi:hypothetical protein
VHPVEDQLVFRDYRNAHNECPPPPIADEASALCHARRLARNLGRSDDWEAWTLERDGDVWAIEYRINDRNRSRRFMTFGAGKAEFRTEMRADLRRR